MSKFARVVCSLRPSLQAQAFQPGRVLSALIRQPAPALPPGLRARSDMIPPNQYDRHPPKIFDFLYVITTYWEVIPLLLVNLAAMSLVFAAIIWACYNKVDVVFTPYNRKNISRTMDLCNPTTHKVITINQRYEEWPELQCVLNEMIDAEKRLKMQSTVCPFAKPDKC